MRQFKDTFPFLIVLTIVTSIIFCSLCISSNNSLVSINTDNFDYILPFSILVIIFYNFKYLKIREEATNVFSLPLSKLDSFKDRYVCSICHISLLYAILLLLSSFVGNVYNINLYVNLNYYYLSLLIKYFILILLFNFFLFCFIKGNKLIDSLCYLILATFVLSLLNFFLLSLFNINISYYFSSIIAPFNVMRSWTLVVTSYNYFVTEGVPFNESIIFLIFFFILSLITIPLNFIEAKNYKLERVERNTSNLLYQISMSILSLTSITMFSLLIDTFATAYCIIIVVNVFIYIIYSTIIGRYVPSNKERVVYFIIFLLGTILPQLI
ncbi:MAG: hypothetical protein R3Y64_10925 [Peptostreptococcaceae bacterium]